MLWPVFALSTVWIIAGLLWVAWAFPEPPRIDFRHGRRWLGAVMTGLGALAGTVSVGPMFGVEAFRWRLLVDFLVIVSLLTLSASVVFRYRRGDAHTRTELRYVLVGLVFVPLLLALAFGASQLTTHTVIHLLLPLMSFVVPLSIGWSLIRHNILESNAVVTRRWLWLPIGAAGAVVAMWGWLALRYGRPSPMDALTPALASGGLFAAVLGLLRRLTGWAIFPAEAQFRPTVEQLADSLSTTRDEGELLEAIARNVTGWLPTGRIRLLAPEALAEIDHLPPEALAELGRGHQVWTTQGPWERELLVPMRSLGALQCVLVVAPKRGRALFTEADLSLLDTLAALGALALHNAAMLRALEASRQIEREASRGDKRATLGLLGAELAHEIAHPLQLFRGLLRKASRGPLGPDDFEVGHDELGRLERLLANMRRLEAKPPRRERLLLAPALDRAAALVRDLTDDRRQTLTLDIDPGLSVVGDPDALVQIFSNLLRNAAQAAPVRGALGVTARAVDGHAAVEVWDNGPGVPDDRVDTIFQRWVTTRDGGTGLGLAVASSLALSLGWKIVYARENTRTLFRLTAPCDPSLSAPPPFETE